MNKTIRGNLKNENFLPHCIVLMGHLTIGKKYTDERHGFVKKYRSLHEFAKDRAQF